VVSEYFTRRQVSVMLLFVLNDLRTASKQEAIRHISHHRLFDIQPEDWIPNPSSQTHEPRWQCLMAWARKTCLIDGFLIDAGRDTWTISRSGVEELNRVQSRYAEGILKAGSCYMWSASLKKRMQLSWEPSPADPIVHSRSSFLQISPKLVRRLSGSQQHYARR
jgi:hypothetical protein